MRRGGGWWVGAVMVVFLFFWALEPDAWARAGGGRSFGGGSSRSFSTPYRGYSRPSPRNEFRSNETPRQPVAPSPSPSQPWGGGGFLRSLAGGIAGGFLGSLLFSSLGYGAGFGGLGGGFGSGIGLLEILLFAGIAFAVVAYLRRRNQEGFARAHGGHFSMGSGGHGGGCGGSHAGTALEELPEAANLQRGLAEVHAVVPGFDDQRFPEEAMDIFFRIQGAWTNRDLEPVRNLLAPEVRQEFQRDLDILKAEGKINRLENIAVRRSEIEEAWVEAGRAFVTIHFLANLLDYTVEEQTGRIVGGSKETPSKFEEYWTFIRSTGGSSWQLTAIQQTAE